MRAGYAVSHMGRQRQLPRLLKTGKDEFLPDFMIRRPVERPDADRSVPALIPLKVKYRADVARFWRREAADYFETAKRWPDLWLVLVTDRPEHGRSCFQALQGADQDATSTTDLERVEVFDVYPSTVLEYSHLAQKLFALLAESRAAQSKSRLG